MEIQIRRSWFLDCLPVLPLSLGLWPGNQSCGQGNCCNQPKRLMNLEHVRSFVEHCLHSSICLRLLRSEAQIAQRRRIRWSWLLLRSRLLLARPRGLTRYVGLRHLIIRFWGRRQIRTIGRRSRHNCRSIRQCHRRTLRRLGTTQSRNRYKTAAKNNSLQSHCSPNSHSHLFTPSPSNITLLSASDS